MYLDRDIVDSTDAPLVFTCDELKIKRGLFTQNLRGETNREAMVWTVLDIDWHIAPYHAFTRKTDEGMICLDDIQLVEGNTLPE